MKRFGTLALSLWLWGAAPAPAAVVDGIVAAVEYDAIALTTLLAYRQAFAPEQALGVALTRLIDDTLLAKEARRYGQTLPAARLSVLATRQAPPGTLDEAEWQALLADRELAEWFLRFRFGDFVPVTREEMRAYYEANRAAFPQPFEAVEERIRALLVPVVRARRIEAYREELRQRYDVRLNAWLLPKE